MDLQQIFNGIAMGGIYAVFAVGYTLVFGILKILNLAHAAVYMLGAVFTLVLVNGLGLSLLTALPVSAVLCGVLGVLLYMAVFKPLRLKGVEENEKMILIIGIAASTVIVSVVQLFIGVNVHRLPAGIFPEHMVTIASFSLSVVQLVILGVSILMMLTLNYLVYRTKIGKAMRAVAENDRTASILGINVERIICYTFFVSSALGAVAGVLIALQTNAVWVFMGGTIELKGLSAIILGGLGSIPGAFLGALFIGFIDVFSTAYLNALWKDAIIFGLLFLTLVVKPSGILGSVAKKRV